MYCFACGLSLSCKLPPMSSIELQRCCLRCCCLYFDLYAPPAVLGAFGAIKVKAPNFAQSSIAGISMAVLALLFAMQPLGTKYLGALYAPILLLWFLLNVSQPGRTAALLMCCS